MACSYCGQTYCSGGCLQGTAYQGQAGQLVFQNPGLAGGGILQLSGAAYNPPTDYGLNEFLEIIADKSDTEACVAFIEKQRQLRDAQVKQLEAMQKQHAEAIEKSEKEFMNRCGKYRPSITAELMTRIKKMKAFF
jgi:predicted flavoprotein YhiN